MEIRKSVIETVDTMCSVFNRAVNDKLYEVWATALNSLSDQQVAYALKRILEEYPGKFMPTPAEFRSYARTETGVQNYEQQAELAWHDLEKALRTVGSYKSVCFSDSCIAEFVRNQGGWPSVCGWLEDEITWKRKEFISEYQTLRRRNQNYDNHIQGICDAGNRIAIANGKITPQIVYVGNFSDKHKEMHSKQIISQYRANQRVLGVMTNPGKVIQFKREAA